MLHKEKQRPMKFQGEVIPGAITRHVMRHYQRVNTDALESYLDVRHVSTLSMTFRSCGFFLICSRSRDTPPKSGECVFRRRVLLTVWRSDEIERAPSLPLSSSAHTRIASADVRGPLKISWLPRIRGHAIVGARKNKSERKREEAARLVPGERKANERRPPDVFPYSHCARIDKEIGTSGGGRRGGEGEGQRGGSDRVFARQRWRDATDERTGWPRGRPCHGDCYGVLGEAHRLPNDRSVDAMLDHPWTIRGSSVDHSWIIRAAVEREREREREREKKKCWSRSSSTSRSTVSTAPRRRDRSFRFRSREHERFFATRPDRAHSRHSRAWTTTLRHVNNDDDDAREMHTRHTLSPRGGRLATGATGDGTSWNADPRARAIAASRRGVRVNRAGAEACRVYVMHWSRERNASACVQFTDFPCFSFVFLNRNVFLHRKKIN